MSNLAILFARSSSLEPGLSLEQVTAEEEEEEEEGDEEEEGEEEAGAEKK